MLHPELFRTEELAGDVETAGEISPPARRSSTAGPTRPHHAAIEVALEIDAAAVADCIVRGLAEAGRQT